MRSVSRASTTTLHTRLQALPGARRVGAVSYLPLSGEGMSMAAAPVGSSGRREPQRRLGDRARALFRNDGDQAAARQALRGRAIARRAFRSRSSTRASRGDGSAAKPTPSASACGSRGGAECSDPYDRRRGARCQSHRAGQDQPADGVCAAEPGVSARDVFRDRDEHRSRRAAARGTCGARVGRFRGADVFRRIGGDAL